jgi:hypothetical protein
VPTVFAMADLDGDGHLDVVTPTADTTTVAPIGVQLGRSNGTFAPTVTYAGTASLIAVLAGDVTGDGHADAIELAQGYATSPSQIVVHPGNGTGALTTPYVIQVPNTAPMDGWIGDLDGDGRNDLVVAAGDGLKVLYGTGSGLGPPIELLMNGGQTAQRIAVADLNRDGRPDLVTTDVVTNTISIRFGQPARAFSPPQTYAVGSNPMFVATADMNNDGLPDVLVAVSSGIAVLLNGG